MINIAQKVLCKFRQRLFTSGATRSDDIPDLFICLCSIALLSSTLSLRLSVSKSSVDSHHLSCKTLLSPVLSITSWLYACTDSCAVANQDSQSLRRCFKNKIVVVVVADLFGLIPTRVLASGAAWKEGHGSLRLFFMNCPAAFLGFKFVLTFRASLWGFWIHVLIFFL